MAGLSYEEMRAKIKAGENYIIFKFFAGDFYIIKEYRHKKQARESLKQFKKQKLYNGVYKLLAGVKLCKTSAPK